MEIERIGANKVRCALTEDEIRQLGFDIDEIIANSETTQQFMRVVLGLVQEHGDIDMEHISPMVKAELMQDHTMAITFGEETEFSFRDLLEAVGHIINQIEPERLEMMREAAREQAQHEPAVCALGFESLERAMEMCRALEMERLPESLLLKQDGVFYLVIDFSGFSREEMHAFAYETADFYDTSISEASQIAHLGEHGSCIIKSGAIETLRSL